jgi:biotin carboxyl carrier protein
MIYDVIINGTNYRLELNRSDAGWECKLNGRAVPMDAVLARPNVISLLVDGQAYEIKREQTATDLHLWVSGVRHAVHLRDPRSLRSRQKSAADHDGPRKLIAAMPGKVVRILVPEKTQIEVGQGILVVEAMKMQNEVKSPKKGIVQKIAVQEGAPVKAGDVLAVVE